MSFLNIFWTSGLVILVLVTILWLVSLKLKDASIVDIFWGLGFVIASWIYFSITPEGAPIRSWVISILVTVWGLRLSLYILYRNWGKEEDYRYQAWRKEAGSGWWWKSYFKVFLLQGALMWIISIPLLAAQNSPTPGKLTVIDFIGVLVWAIGFFFEAVGDWQLARFKSIPSNKGKLFTNGVWRYTRHPNYFGDAFQWWGFYLIAASTYTGVWTIFSPILMTFFLLRVSGVTLLESSLKNAKPGYADYITTTNAFFPWFPRKS